MGLPEEVRLELLEIQYGVGRPEEKHGQEDKPGADQPQVEDGTPHRLFMLPQPKDVGQEERQEQEDPAIFGGEGQAGEHSRQEIIPRPAADIDLPDEEERGEQEEDHSHVGDHVVRYLDMLQRQGQEQGGQQTRPRVEHGPADDEQEEHRPQAEEYGDQAPEKDGHGRVPEVGPDEILAVFELTQGLACLVVDVPHPGDQIAVERGDVEEMWVHIPAEVLDRQVGEPILIDMEHVGQPPADADKPRGQGQGQDGP